MDKVFYNESSAAKLGWTPEWFGCTSFDEDLVDSIKDWQSQMDYVGLGHTEKYSLQDKAR